MRKKRYVGYSFFLALMFLCITVLNGCGNDPVEITMPEQVASPISQESKKLNVDVYWDATYSMQGYVTISNGNFYRTLPDELGDIGNTMGETTFYRFGKEIKQLDGREYRRFSEPNYYDEVITAFHNVVDKADASHLSIVVTDLFESDSDWTNVTKKLKEKYFSQHLAVGIIGVKNPFNGDIFDVGLNAAKYSYNSGNNPDKFRPFYLFIMGPEQNVTDFINRWKGRQTDGVDMQYLLLSDNLTEEAADFSRLEIKESDNVYSDANLGIKDKRIREFGVSSFSGDTMLVSSFDYRPRFGVLPFDMDKLDFKTEVFALEDNQWTSVNDMSGTFDVVVVPDTESTDKYDISVKFVPELVLKEDTINFVHISARPTEAGFQMPEWVRQWNMANIDVAPQQFDGSKTINLLHVIESLKTSIIQASHPSLVNMNMVIDCR